MLSFNLIQIIQIIQTFNGATGVHGIERPCKMFYYWDYIERVKRYLYTTETLVLTSFAHDTINFL